MTEDKYRHWFLEINESAECFKTLKTAVESLERVKYGLIYHNKDITEDGEVKKPHYHIMLSYENARTFTAIQKLFKGAHIEKAVNVSKCVQYLIHQNDQTKHRYEPSEIITNNLEWIKSNLASKSYPILEEEIIFEEIKNLKNRGFNYAPLVYFYIKFGNEQVKPFRQMILDVWKDFEAIKDLEMIADEQLPF